MARHRRHSQATREGRAATASTPETRGPGQSPQVNALFRLQQTIGNRAVQRLLQRGSAGRQNRARTTTPGAQGVYREDEPVPLTGIGVNHPRVTVPPEAGLSFSATKDPANASDVTFSLEGDNASIASGTTIDSSSGAITVADDQSGGSAEVQAEQVITAEDGSTREMNATAPFNFTAIPSGITSTSASAGAGQGNYGGDFTHTFTSPGGGQSALERSRVNEHFPAASGTTLSLTGEIGTLNVTVNNPTSASAGWDLDSNGEMGAPDRVSWSDAFSARPFVANASNPTPDHTLPQELTATQEFRSRSHPSRTYGTTAIASTTHRRAFELREGHIVAVTSSNSEEVVEDYVGPTVFKNATASPDTIPAAAPAPDEGEAPAPTTASIAVEMEGQDATPTFTIQSPDLGCTIDADGELTPGTTAGTVTVRAGDNANYDEVTVTITAPPESEQEDSGESEPEAEP